MLGALIGATKLLKFETVEDTLKEKLGHKKELIKSNITVLKKGYDFAIKNMTKKVKV